jgi:hypothetical protein
LDQVVPIGILKHKFPKDLRVFRIQQGNVPTIAVDGATDAVHEAFDESAKFDLPGRLRSETSQKLEVLTGDRRHKPIVFFESDLWCGAHCPSFWQEMP